MPRRSPLLDVLCRFQMKKKIIAILSVFSLLAFAGGAYLIFTVEHSAANFDELIMLHQVEILREHLLLNIHRVQEDLYSQSTRHPESVDAMANHVGEMENSINTCFECHHVDAVLERFEDLQQQIGQYRHAMSSALVVLPKDARRRRDELEKASTIGDSLIGKVNTLIILTNKRLNERTESSLRDLERTKITVTVLVAAGPLLIAFLGFTAIGGITKPIQTLLRATKRLKSGDLEHRIVGLKDEFGELAVAFDDMAHALKERMREIAESERRYRLLFEIAGDAIFILDAEGEQRGRIVAANRAASTLHGYTMEELLTLGIQDIDASDASAEAPGRIERILRGEWIKAELNHVKKDGTEFPVEISAGVFEFDNHKYILAIDRDITERKRADEAIQRAEHIRTAGELATGLAHEIKNPLAGIKVTVEALAEASSLSEEDKGVLVKVAAEIKRIEGLIKGLLQFARPPKPQYTATDVNGVLAAAAQLVVTNLVSASKDSHAVGLQEAFGRDLPAITADPMQLKQVFMNLLLNAVDAMPSGGTLSLKTAYDRMANIITVSVSDTGKGVDPAIREKLFQPFFTTKAKGTGLGLAISKRLIEDHGGKISIENNEGGGSTFRITLPCGHGKGCIDHEG